MIKAVKFVTVPAADQDRSLEFFTEKLGFSVATDQPFNEEQRWIELRIPGADTRLRAGRHPPLRPPASAHGLSRPLSVRVYVGQQDPPGRYHKSRQPPCATGHRLGRLDQAFGLIECLRGFRGQFEGFGVGF